MITTTRTTTRRARATSSRSETSAARGVPRRALADGVVERRRSSRRRTATVAAPMPYVPPAPEEELRPLVLSPTEHYRLERQRRADRETGQLATLLAEAKAEYEAMLAAPRPAGKGGRPRKRPVRAADEFDLEPLGDDNAG